MISVRFSHPFLRGLLTATKIEMDKEIKMTGNIYTGLELTPRIMKGENRKSLTTFIIIM